jgi:hypothetical protein
MTENLAETRALQEGFELAKEAMERGQEELQKKLDAWKVGDFSICSATKSGDHTYYKHLEDCGNARSAVRWTSKRAIKDAMERGREGLQNRPDA